MTAVNKQTNKQNKKVTGPREDVEKSVPTRIPDEDETVTTTLETVWQSHKSIKRRVMV